MKKKKAMKREFWGKKPQAAGKTGASPPQRRTKPTSSSNPQIKSYLARKRSPGKVKG